MDSEDIWHRRCRPGGDSDYQLTARISIEQPTGEDTFQAIVREELLRTEAPNLGALEVTWYESPTFPTLRDAQLFADWAITRWHSEEQWSAAGFEWVDLDPQGNPWA